MTRKTELEVEASDCMLSLAVNFDTAEVSAHRYFLHSFAFPCSCFSSVSSVSSVVQSINFWVNAMN